MSWPVEELSVRCSSASLRTVLARRLTSSKYFFSNWMTDSREALAKNPPVFFSIIPGDTISMRSEEHTSELQSRLHLVCRLLLEKKKKKNTTPPPFKSNTVHLY